MARALNLPLQEVVTGPAVSTTAAGSSASSTSLPESAAGPTPPRRRPPLAADGEESDDEDGEGDEAASGGLVEEKEGGEEADDELDGEEEAEEEEAQELLDDEEGNAAVAAAALGSAFPGFIASLDDGASLCAMYSLEHRAGPAGGGTSANSRRRKRRRRGDGSAHGVSGAVSGGDGDGDTSGGRLSPQSLRVYVSKAFAAAFFPASTYRSMIAQQLPEHIYAHLVDREDRHAFVVALASHLFEATLAGGQQAPAPASSQASSSSQEVGAEAGQQQEEHKPPQAEGAGAGEDEGEEQNPTSQAEDERFFSQVLRFLDRHGRCFPGLIRVRLCLTRSGGLAGAIAITPLPSSKYILSSWMEAEAAGTPAWRTVLTRCSSPRIHPWAMRDSPFHARHHQQRPSPQEQLENRLHFLNWRRCRPEQGEEEEQEERSQDDSATYGSESVPVTMTSMASGARDAGATRRKEALPPRPLPSTVAIPFAQLAPSVGWTSLAPAGFIATEPPMANPFAQQPPPFPRGAAPQALLPRPPLLAAPLPAPGDGGSPQSSPFRQMAGLVRSPVPLPVQGQQSGEVWFDAFCEAFYEGPTGPAPGAMPPPVPQAP